VKDPDDPAKNVWFIRDADVYGMASLEVAWVCFAGFDYQLEFDYKGENSLIVRVPNNRATPDITTPVGKSSEWTHFSCVFTKAKAHVSDAIMINRRGEGDVHVTNLRLRRVLPPLGKDSPAPKPKRDPSTIPPPEPQPARGPNLMPEGDFEGDEFPSPWKLPCDFSFYGMKWGALEVARDPDDETNRVLKLYGTRSRKHAGLQAWRHPKLPAGKYKFTYRAKGGSYQFIAPHPPDVTTTKISFRATPNNLAFDGPPIGVSQDWQTFEIPITVTNDFSGIVLIITEVYPGQEEYFDDFHLEKIE